MSNNSEFMHLEMAKNNHTLIRSAMKLTTYLVDSLESLITVIVSSNALLSIKVVSHRFLQSKVTG